MVAQFLDDEDFDALATMAGVVVLGYLVVNFIRSRAATDSAGPVFDSTGPYFPEINRAADILVPMQISSEGANFIRLAEGFSPTRKPDSKGKQQIGYGHNIQPGEDIPQQISEAQAEQILQRDLDNVAGTLNDTVTVALTQNQFDALASLVYNIGQGQWGSSTILRLLNQGDYAGAAAQFTRWDKSAGGINQALLARRQAEQGTFQS